MLRKYAQFLASIQVALDSALVVTSLVMAFWLAFHSELSLPEALQSHHFIALAMIAALSWPTIAGLLELYRNRRVSSFAVEATTVLKASSLSSTILVLGIYFLNFKDLPRPLIIYFGVCCLLLLSIERLILRWFVRWLRGIGYNSRRVIIVGAGNLGLTTYNRILANPWMGLRVIGFVDDYRTESPIGDMRILGRISDLEDISSDFEVDRIFIALPTRAYARIHYIAERLLDRLTEISVIPDIYQSITLNASVTDLDGLPLINLAESSIHGWDAVIKRALDLCVAITGLIICLPMMIIITILIKCTTRGPVLFKQWRYGVDGKLIKIYKFRTMDVMEDGSQVRQAQRNDSRINPLGAILRRFSLDELPQFWNVLQGRMSVVGPRPHAVAHNEQYRRLIKAYMLRHKVKPGITGWAQINGWRGETDTLDKMENRVKFDKYYIENWSVWLDIKIIALTVWKGFFHENAY